MSLATEGLLQGGQKVDASIYTGQEFFTELCEDVASTRAGDRIAVATMDFDVSDPMVGLLFNEVEDAAHRKVEIDLAVCAFALLEPRPTVGPIVLPLPLSREVYQNRVAPLARLGGLPTARCSVINQPRGPLVWNYFAGRSHIKLAVVNDNTKIGGPSLQGSGRIDAVVGINDSKTADILYGMAKSLVKHKSTREALGDSDFVIPVDDITDIYVDAGVRGQSGILDKTLDIIDSAAEEVTISSPFFLTGVAGDHLASAYHKGVEIYLAHNHVSKYEQLRFVHRAIKARERMRRPAAFFKHQVPQDLAALHAKVVANEDVGMVASHNFVENGVKFGTAEIAVVRRDPVFAKAAKNIILSQV